MFVGCFATFVIWLFIAVQIHEKCWNEDRAMTGVLNIFFTIGLAFYLLFMWPINYWNNPDRVICREKGGQYSEKRSRCFTEIEINDAE